MNVGVHVPLRKNGCDFGHNFCVLPFINHIGNVLRLSHHPEVMIRLLDITQQSTIAMNLFPLHFFSNVSASC